MTESDEQITIRNGWIVPLTHGFIFCAIIVVINVISPTVSIGAWLTLFFRVMSGITIITYSISLIWMMLDFAITIKLEDEERERKKRQQGTPLGDVPK